MTTFDDAIAAPRDRRARLRREYVGALLFWAVVIGVFAFWTFVWAKGGEDQASSSYAIARRHLNYELWYAVHFTAYAAIALAFFHEVPAGNELVHNPRQAEYVWDATCAAAAALVIWYRLLLPIVQNWRYRLKITEIAEEGPGVWSVRISGRGVSRYGARAGQSFFWRFLTRGFWYTQHPFSISEAPKKGDSFRITV